MQHKTLVVRPSDLPSVGWPEDYGQWQSYLAETWPELYAVSTVTVRLGHEVQVRIKCDAVTAKAWNRALHGLSLAAGSDD